jgi:hypothetical protein
MARMPERKISMACVNALAAAVNQVHFLKAADCSHASIAIPTMQVQSRFTDET